MNVFENLQQIQRILKQVDHLLATAENYSKEHKFDVENLLRSRLIANMFDLRKQVQVATDTAKFIAFRLAGKEAPAFEDSPTATLEELRERVKRVIGLLSEFKESDFDGYKERKIPIGFRPGKYLTGEDYYARFSVPNFYFHATVIYSILRANGIPLAKGDFLGEVPFKDL